MSTVLWIMTLVLALASSSNSVNDSLPSSLEVKMKYNFTDEQLEMKRSNGMLEEFKKFIRDLLKKDEEIFKKDEEIVKKDEVIVKVTGKMQSLAFVCAHILARSSNLFIFKKNFNTTKKLSELYKVNDDSPVCQPLLNENRDEGSTERKNCQKWLQSIYENDEPYGKGLRREITKIFYNHSNPRIKTNAFMLCACTFAKQERIGNEYANWLEKFVNVLKSARNGVFAVVTHDEFNCLYALVLTAAKKKLQWIPYDKDEDYIILQVNPEDCVLPNHLDFFLIT